MKKYFIKNIELIFDLFFLVNDDCLKIIMRNLSGLNDPDCITAIQLNK